ncbi:MAG: ATP synthase F1 subunit gamma [Chlorobi bacterium]|nr:ATP synthase F1 subunit gamma [Chlorobiota bacterium]
MAGLKEIRTRISSVKSTRQITSAMKMVAAAKLKKNQDKITSLRPYANKLHDVLTAVRESMEEDFENVLMSSRKPQKVLIILVTSNRGLCGGFNANVIHKALDVAEEIYPRQWKTGNLSFFAIGKKGADFIRSNKFLLAGVETEVFDHLDFHSATQLANQFTEEFITGKYDRIDFIYNRFKNAVVQMITHEHFLPVHMEEKETGPAVDYIFEPQKDLLLETLIPDVLKVQFYKVLLDSFASEHGARMTAMHQATDNADDLIHELTLHYNKARQASITKEILDIVGGAEALR